MRIAESDLRWALLQAFRLGADQRAGISRSPQPRPPATGPVLDVDVIALMRSALSQGYRGWWKTIKITGHPRIKLDDYEMLMAIDSRLEAVKGGKVHALIKEPLSAFLAAAANAGFQLKITNGWRPRPWSDYEAYAAAMVAQYGSLQEGKRWRAWKSPHYAGLAVDLAGDGLSASSATAEEQRKLPVTQWLLANAPRFGAVPYGGTKKDGTWYQVEPWHWEFLLPRSLF